MTRLLHRIPILAAFVAIALCPGTPLSIEAQRRPSSAPPNPAASALERELDSLARLPITPQVIQRLRQIDDSLARRQRELERRMEQLRLDYRMAWHDEHRERTAAARTAGSSVDSSESDTVSEVSTGGAFIVASMAGAIAGGVDPHLGCRAPCEQWYAHDKLGHGFGALALTLLMHDAGLTGWRAPVGTMVFGAMQEVAQGYFSTRDLVWDTGGAWTAYAIRRWLLPARGR